MTSVMVKYGDPAGPGPRERMVAGAAELIRARGVVGVGVRQIVEHAQAPRGSVQHYFPGGKDQLVAEAVALAAAHTAAVFERAADAEPALSPAQLVEVICGYWRRVLEGSDFGAGCTVFCTAVLTHGQDAVQPVVGEAFDRWQRPLSRALRRAGVSEPSQADGLAVLLIASVEGAIVLARAQRSVAPLEAVGVQLVRSIEAAATVGGNG